VFPENWVSQVCVKLYPSGRIHVIFVEEPEAEELSSKEPKNAVSVELVITRLATLSDGRFLENPRPLERSLERIRVLQSVKKEVSFKKLAQNKDKTR
jgi:transposase